MDIVITYTYLYDTLIAPVMDYSTYVDLTAATIIH